MQAAAMLSDLALVPRLVPSLVLSLNLTGWPAVIELRRDYDYTTTTYAGDYGERSGPHVMDLMTSFKVYVRAAALLRTARLEAW